MFQPNSDQNKSNTKTVILAAECLHGFIEAGSFAKKFLLDDHTRIILLNAFQRPMEAASRLRNFNLILKQNAEEDLSLIKTTLIKDYGLASEKIEKVTIEGELNSIIGSNFNDLDNLSIVLGYDFNIPDRKDYYKSLLSSLLKSINRPIFIISDFVTVIESSGVVVISQKEKMITPVFLNSLMSSSEQYKVEVEIVTSDNGNAIEMSNDTSVHFSRDMNSLDFSTIFSGMPSASI